MNLRRHLLIIGTAAAIFGSWMWSSADRFDGDALDPQAVHKAAAVGSILLIDIRRPDEWATTGLPEHGHGIDMRRDDFQEALLALAGTTERPIALICARGVRSDRLSARLTQAGFTRIIDVPEGMLGSSAGPGWLARDLPVSRP
ncbi:rhodanese-like domain-containing protein [Jannaschia aquimarina]|uniref:Molybdopterin biosynthesis protein MoeB n=1 Tax=Jannaschia aquimarina TaxID=935700 RepID=A0A0D1EJ35_9RHOB|nr:rhodanese-like domain-containing protein [Jannaschia aquimarina]KIT15800.1 molybdopterin biosynthesis protein MoeB [Jannaschia aquimarina]SNT42870.1 Rhodanese-related sulfurtransferase [Jannaschia aquimarina]